MALYQKNRIYSLTVWTDSGAVEISNLQVVWQVTKTSNNKEKKNKAEISIYNLTREHQKAFEEDNVTIEFRAGYSDLIGEGDDIPLLFTGQVVDMENTEGGDPLVRRERTDVITTLTVDELYQQVNTRIVSRTIPAGKSVKDAILGIVQDMPEITRQEIKGKNVEKQMIDGYSLSGSPRQLFDELSKVYKISWQIDNNILYVADEDGTYTENKETVPKIGQFSGIISSPKFKYEDPKRIVLKDKYKSEEKKPKERGKGKQEKKKVKTLHLTILMNPTLTAGSLFHLDWEDLTGYYRIDEVRHYGDYRGKDWYSDLIISAYN